MDKFVDTRRDVAQFAHQRERDGKALAPVDPTREDGSARCTVCGAEEEEGVSMLLAIIPIPIA